MDLVGGEQTIRRDAERRRHARAILGDVAGIVVRADAAIETGIKAVRDAACAREESVADSGERQRRGLYHHRCFCRYFSNPGSTPNFGSAIASTLNSSPMPFGPVSVSRASALSISAVLSVKACDLSMA